MPEVQDGRGLDTVSSMDMAVPSIQSVLPSGIGTAANLSQRIHAILESAIINGQLEPEQRLQDTEIAQHLQVSRMPVREALKSLSEAGWVEVRPRQGVRVRSRRPDELRDLFECRAEVDRVVARFAARRRDEAHMERLRSIIELNVLERAKPHPDVNALDANSIRFYETLRAAAGNAVLADTSAALQKRARFYFITVLAELGTSWTLAHEMISQHVIAGDSELAGDAMYELVRGTGSATARLLFG